MLERLAAAGVRARRVEDYRATSARPELARLGALETLVHPITGVRQYLGIPLRVDGCPLASRAAAPVFDQHGDALLRSWLGLETERIRALRAAGAVAALPGTVPARGR